MVDISGFGSGITIVALQSFPMGFSVTQFSDDVDPVSAEEMEPTGYEPLYDGSLFFFDKTAPIKVNISVIPGSDDDINLKILLQSRKGSLSLIPLPDSTTMVVTYPNGGRVVLSDGSIVKGPVMDSVQNSGRKKGNTYTFVFGSFAGAQSPKEFIAGVGQTILGLL